MHSVPSRVTKMLTDIDEGVLNDREIVCCFYWTIAVISWREFVSNGGEEKQQTKQKNDKHFVRTNP